MLLRLLHQIFLHALGNGLLPMKSFCVVLLHMSFLRILFHKQFIFIQNYSTNQVIRENTAFFAGITKSGALQS